MFSWAKYRILTRLLQSWQTLGTASRWSAKPSLTAPNFFHPFFFRDSEWAILYNRYTMYIEYTKTPGRIPILDPVLMFFDSRFGYILKWWVLPMGSFGLFIGGSRSHFRKHGVAKKQHCRDISAPKSPVTKTSLPVEQNWRLVCTGIQHGRAPETIHREPHHLWRIRIPSGNLT